MSLPHPRPTGKILHQAAAWVQILVLVFGPVSALAEPTEPTVVAGAAVVRQPDPTTTLIQQLSDRAIINWKGFSIDVNELVRFDQPSSAAVALNRVTGQDPSTILGQLSANGRVFLVNPNGVVFGPGARVDVAGLLATTFDIKDSDFMAGKMEFAQDPQAKLAAIVNKGEIRVSDEGFVFLVGAAASNEGLIVAKLGKVVLAAGQKLVLDFNGDGLVNYAIEGQVLEKVIGPDGKPLASAVSNSGEIQADGGSVVLHARGPGDAFSSVVNNSGIIRARSLKKSGGVVRLEASNPVDSEVRIGVTNNLDRVPEALGTVLHSGLIDVSGAEADALPGAVLLTGERVGVSGDILAQGGSVLIRSTLSTVVTRSSLIDVSATADQAAGTAVLWSDRDTRFFGTLVGRGAVGNPDGADVEVSGHENLAFDGLVDLGEAAGGTAGTVLLDPMSVITGSFGTDDGQITGDSEILFADGGAAGFLISDAALEGLTGNINIEATYSVTLAGSLDLLNLGMGEVFTVNCGGSIYVTGGILTAGGAVDLIAGLDAVSNPTAALSVTGWIGAPGGRIYLENGDPDLGGGSGGIYFNGMLSTSWLATSQVYLIATGGGITQGPAGFINATGLGILSSGDVILDGAHNVETIAGAVTGAGSSFFFRSTGTLVTSPDVSTGVLAHGSLLANFSFFNRVGLLTNNGPITIRAEATGASLTVITPLGLAIDAGTSTVDLRTPGVLTIGGVGTVINADGGLNLVMDQLNLVALSISVANVGSVVSISGWSAGRNIVIGGADSGTQLGLTIAELDAIDVTNGFMRIGSSTGGSVSVNSAWTPKAAGLTLRSGGTISQLATAPITVGKLAALVRGGGDVNLAAVANPAAFFAADTDGGSVYLQSSLDLAVSDVDLLSGITMTGTTGADVCRLTAGSVTVDLSTTVNVGDAGLELIGSGAGGIVMRSSAVAQGGSVRFNADRMTFATDSSTLATTGDVVIVPRSGTTMVDLGAADAAGILGLGDSELDTLAATLGWIRIDSVAQIFARSAISIDSGMAKGLYLNVTGAGNSIGQNGLATLSMALLYVTAPGSVLLAENNDVNYLAANITGAGSLFQFVDANSLAIGIASLGGVRTSNGAISLRAGRVTASSLLRVTDRPGMDVDAGTASVALVVDGGLSLDPGAGVRGLAGVDYSATNLSLNPASATDSGTSATRIFAFPTGTLVNLGGADGGATLGVTDAELDTITAGSISIQGDNDIMVSALVRPALVNSLQLTTTGGSIYRGGSGAISVQFLSLSSFGDVLLDGANDIAVLAGTVTDPGAGFTFYETSGLTVGNLIGLNGVRTNNGAIKLVANSLAAPASGFFVTDTLAAVEIDAGTSTVEAIILGSESTLDLGAAPVRGLGGVTYVADRMTIGAGGATNAGTGVAWLTHASAGRQIQLGSVDGPGVLGLLDAELDTITAGTLRVGNLTTPGYAVTGAITFAGAVGPAGTGGLSLQANALISQTSPITVSRLSVVSATGVSLTMANDVDTLAGYVTGAGGSFSFGDADDLTIGTVDSLSGVTTNNGAASLTAGAGNLVINDVIVGDDDVATGTNTLTLTSSGGSILTSGAASVAGATTNFVVGGAGNIGSAGTPVPVTADTISFNATGTGAVWIQEADGGTVSGLTAGDNASLVTTTGDWQIAAGGINVGTGSLLLNAVAGDVLDTAGGMLTGSSVFLNAGATDGSIGSAAAPVRTTAGSISFAGAGTGEVAIREANGALVDGTAGSGGMQLVTLTGNWTLDSLATFGDAQITATVGAILDDADGGATDLSAAGILLVAPGGVGVGNALEIAGIDLAGRFDTGGFAVHDVAGGLNVDTVAGTAGILDTNLTSAADLSVSALGPLVVKQDVTAAGNVSLSALEVSDAPSWNQDLTLDALAQVQSTLAGVTLTAGDDLFLDGTVQAALNATLTAGSLDADGGGSLVMSNDATLSCTAATLAATGSAWISRITATGAVTVVSNGSVLDGSIVDPNITTGGRVTLRALGGVVGTNTDPIEIDVTADVWVEATRSEDGSSAVLTGTINPEDTIHDLAAAPGKIVWNNRVVGGSAGTTAATVTTALLAAPSRALAPTMITEPPILPPDTASSPASTLAGTNPSVVLPGLSSPLPPTSTPTFPDGQFDFSPAVQTLAGRPRPAAIPPSSSSTGQPVTTTVATASSGTTTTMPGTGTSVTASSSTTAKSPFRAAMDYSRIAGKLDKGLNMQGPLGPMVDKALNRAPPPPGKGHESARVDSAKAGDGKSSLTKSGPLPEGASTTNAKGGSPTTGPRVSSTAAASAAADAGPKPVQAAQSKWKTFSSIGMSQSGDTLQISTMSKKEMTAKSSWEKTGDTKDSLYNRTQAADAELEAAEAAEKKAKDAEAKAKKDQAGAEKSMVNAAKAEEKAKKAEAAAQAAEDKAKKAQESAKTPAEKAKANADAAKAAAAKAKASADKTAADASFRKAQKEHAQALDDQSSAAKEKTKATADKKTKAAAASKLSSEGKKSALKGAAAAGAAAGANRVLASFVGESFGTSSSSEFSTNAGKVTFGNANLGASMTLGDVQAKANARAGWDKDKGEFYAEAGASFRATALEIAGHAKFSAGPVDFEFKGHVRVGTFSAEAKAGIVASLTGIKAQASAEVRATALEIYGEANVGFGNFGSVTATATQRFMTVYAKAEANAMLSTEGVRVGGIAEAGASIYEVQGTASVGLGGGDYNCGNIGVKGGAVVGVVAKAEAAVGFTREEGFRFKLGAKIALGVGLELGLDFNIKPPKVLLDAVDTGIKGARNFLGDLTGFGALKVPPPNPKPASVFGKEARAKQRETIRAAMGGKPATVPR